MEMKKKGNYRSAMILASALICLLLLNPISAISQINVLDTGTEKLIGRHSITGSPIIELNMRVSAEQDTTYRLTYRDRTYTHIVEYKSLEFFDRETLLQFRDIVMSVFESPNDRNRDYKVQFTLPTRRGSDVLVEVSTMRQMGITTSTIFVARGGYTTETRRNWEKVFEGL